MTAARLPATVVLLGASNLARALVTLYGITQDLLGAGTGDYFIATGHGRSYGLYSRVLGRGLPGIVQSGLWQAIEQHDARGKVYALLTDIGNDIAYGQNPAQILEWVRVCIERLRARNANIIMTALPLASLEQLGPARFFLYRTLLFPSNTHSLPATLAAARALNVQLQQLATEYGIPLIQQPQDWFGSDPVHIRRRDFAAAYRTILNHWRAQEPLHPARPAVPLPMRLRLVTATPEWQDFFRWRQQRSQPIAVHADGSSISFY